MARRVTKNDRGELTQGGGGYTRTELAAMRLGYEAARRHLPYAADYDAWQERVQLAYETGRAWSANMIGAGVKPPAWAGRWTYGPPDAVLAADRRAGELTGGNWAIPFGQLQNTDDPVLLDPASLPMLRRIRRRR